jgi:hypothetical protein
VAYLFEDYFRGYASAFDDFDAVRVASYFYCPCVMVSPDFVASLDTEEAILRNSEGILRHHEAEGYGRAAVSDFGVDRPAENLAIVAVRWRIHRSDDSILWTWKNSYNLVDHSEGWKILVSTIHDPD